MVLIPSLYIGNKLLIEWSAVLLDRCLYQNFRKFVKKLEDLGFNGQRFDCLSIWTNFRSKKYFVLGEPLSDDWSLWLVVIFLWIVLILLGERLSTQKRLVSKQLPHKEFINFLRESKSYFFSSSVFVKYLCLNVIKDNFRKMHRASCKMEKWNFEMCWCGLFWYNVYKTRINWKK